MLIEFVVITQRGVVAPSKVFHSYGERFFEDSHDPLIVALLQAGGIKPAEAQVIEITSVAPSTFTPGMGPPGPAGPAGPPGPPGPTGPAGQNLTLSVIAYTSDQTLSISQSGDVFSNEGASGPIAITLPSGAANGLQYIICVQNPNYVRLNADIGSTINLGAGVTVSGGFVRSNVVGSCGRFIKLSSTQWFAEALSGTWTIDS